MVVAILFIIAGVILVKWGIGCIVGGTGSLIARIKGGDDEDEE